MDMLDKLPRYTQPMSSALWRRGHSVQEVLSYKIFSWVSLVSYPAQVVTRLQNFKWCHQGFGLWLGFLWREGKRDWAIQLHIWWENVTSNSRIIDTWLMVKRVKMIKNGGPDLKRARLTGLSARRARRTKSRGPKGLQLEVGARRAPRLLVIDIVVYI